MGLRSIAAAGCLAFGVADVLVIGLVIGPAALAGAVAPASAAPVPVPVLAGAEAPAPVPVPVTETETEVVVAAAEAKAEAEAEPVAAAVTEPVTVTVTVPVTETETESETETETESETETDTDTDTAIVRFESGRDALSAAAEAVLVDVAGRMAGDVGLVVRVEGHADARGEHDLNDGLSRRRAERVAEFLRGPGGVEPARVTVRAFGETRPLDEGDGPAADRVNRRVELLLERRPLHGGTR